MMRYLRNSHVDSTVVLTDVEVEILIVNAHVATIGQVSLEAAVVGAELFQKVCERIAELNHTLGRYRYLRPRAASRYSLRHL